uniref:Uncharacterized protein n=1 Tax=Physcomitrium patens TaxID=3218 RepID=A0A2K1K7P8_PHYPA|nr:hypothetical protein PHYPA_011699 [Physcomitrium patens]
MRRLHHIIYICHLKQRALTRTRKVPRVFREYPKMFKNYCFICFGCYRCKKNCYCKPKSVGSMKLQTFCSLQHSSAGTSILSVLVWPN